MDTLLQQVVYKRTYSKYLKHLNRREHWSETVDRVVNHLFEDIDEIVVSKYKEEVRENILNLRVMPSMRLCLTAGECAKNNNIAGYNCCYVAVDDIKVFGEVLLILMSGCGVGFSVEKDNIDKLPIVPTLEESLEIFVFEDSKIGWAIGLNHLFEQLYSGKIPKFDYSLIRKKGVRVSMGGYASGSQCLIELIDFIIGMFRISENRKLKDIEVHSILTKIGSIVQVAGTRRSAMISLSDLDSEEMAKCKSDDWYIKNIHYALANNSAVYNNKPDVGTFLQEWTTIYKSYSGERGFFNREAGIKKMLENGRRVVENLNDLGVNPCVEILIKSCEFCNLSEVVLRPEDTEETIKDKIRIASIIGTLQSRFTNFPFLRPLYKKNCEEERLLGVSMTGIFDNKLTTKPTKEFLNSLRDVAVDTNKIVAGEICINVSAAITAIKPSGSVSALCDTSSGLHPAYAEYYIRRIRISKDDPICKLLQDANIPNEQDFYGVNNIVFSFPMKSAKGAVLKKDVGAVEHFELWLQYYQNYTEHKPSITISYSPDEFIDLTAAIWKNFDSLAGISLLPRDTGSYQQTPFEEINEEQYNKMLLTFPKSINWFQLSKYEKEDNFNEATLLCVGNNCEV